MKGRQMDLPLPPSRPIWDVLVKLWRGFSFIRRLYTPLNTPPPVSPSIPVLPPFSPSPGAPLQHDIAASPSDAIAAVAVVNCTSDSTHLQHRRALLKISCDISPSSATPAAGPAGM